MVNSCKLITVCYSTLYVTDLTWYAQASSLFLYTVINKYEGTMSRNKNLLSNRLRPSAPHTTAYYKQMTTQRRIRD
jgi:hypothetical protein